MYRSTVDRVIPTIRQKQTDGSPGEYRSFRRFAAGKSIEVVCRSCALAERRGKNNNEDKLTGRTAVGFSERKNKQKDLRRGGGVGGGGNALTYLFRPAAARLVRHFIFYDSLLRVLHARGFGSRVRFVSLCVCTRTDFFHPPPHSTRPMVIGRQPTSPEKAHKDTARDFITPHILRRDLLHTHTYFVYSRFLFERERETVSTARTENV